MIVADTDVLVDFLRGASPGRERVGQEIESGALHTTAISRFEVLSGARTPAQLQKIQTLLEGIRTLPLDTRAADRSAEVRRQLEQKGHSIGLGDGLIAGTVLTWGGVLLTRNQKHFERVRNLRIENPAE